MLTWEWEWDMFYIVVRPHVWVYGKPNLGIVWPEGSEGAGNDIDGCCDWSSSLALAWVGLLGRCSGALTVTRVPSVHYLYGLVLAFKRELSDDDRKSTEGPAVILSSCRSAYID